MPSPNRHSRHRRMIGTIAGAVALWVGATAAAQNAPPAGPAAAKPPTARVADKPPLLGNIVVGVLILAAVLTASLLPSKRGHQD